MREMSAFVVSFPRSKYREEARELAQRARRRLADHEFYVADFYLQRGKYEAAIGRLEGVLADFPGADDPRALFQLGQSYLGLRKSSEARKQFAQVVTKFPTDHHAPKAKNYLDFIDRTQR